MKRWQLQFLLQRTTYISDLFFYGFKNALAIAAFKCSFLLLHFNEFFNRCAQGSNIIGIYFFGPAEQVVCFWHADIQIPIVQLRSGYPVDIAGEERNKGLIVIADVYFQ